MKNNQETPPDTGFRITKIHAFTCIDENDVEGVAGFLGPGGTFWPMVCADPARVDSLRPVAQQIATGRRVKITLAEFSVRKDVEAINP